MNTSQTFRRAVMRICAALYRETGTDISDAVIVAGAARSGTTWIAELITLQMGGRLMFEPFNPDLVPEYANYNYFQYMRPQEEDAQLRRFVEAVLSGRIRHPWIDRYVDRLRPRGRLVKDIRANLLLRWIHDRFPEVPIVFIVRHPCAVVASRMKLGWATDEDVGRFLEQRELVDDFLADKLDLVHAAKDDVEKHSIVWCISNLVPLAQFSDSELNVVFYEDVERAPSTAVPRLLELLGIKGSRKAIEAATRPSMTAISRSGAGSVDTLAPWRRHLSAEQVRRVLNIVESFGLAYLYDDDGRPSPRTS